MKLTVNGELHEEPAGATLTSLLASLGVAPERVAVMLNGDVVSKETRETVRLKEGDRIELLTFAGGG